MMVQSSETFVFVGGPAGAGASSASSAQLHLLSPHPVDPGGELDGVEGLRVVAGLRGYVG